MKKFSINNQIFTLAQILASNPDEANELESELNALSVGETIERHHDETITRVPDNGYYTICFSGEVATLVECGGVVMRGVVVDSVTVCGDWNGDGCLSYIVEGIHWMNVPKNESPEMRNFSIVHSGTDIGGHELHIDGEKVCHLRTGKDGSFRLKFIGDSKLVR